MFTVVFFKPNNSSLSQIEIIKDLSQIAQLAIDKEEENVHFWHHVQRQDSQQVDSIVIPIQETITKAIDCTNCGNCCQKLIINVDKNEINKAASFLNVSSEKFKSLYIEESQSGFCFINTIPCHFLSEKKCNIYAARFEECSAFPHLHKPGFKERLLGALLHFGSCPIIFNVVEQMKKELSFFNTEKE